VYINGSLIRVIPMADIGNWLILLVTVLVFVVLLYTLEATEIFILAHAKMMFVQTLQILHHLKIHRRLVVGVHTCGMEIVGL